jgi:hypothetical protein
MDQEVLQGCIRSGTAFCLPPDVLATDIAVLDQSLFICKIPDQLQQLVVDEH